jgi:hypothetical protein
MAGGGAFQFAVPRGQRFDDPNGVKPDLVLWRGLDPNRGWNAANYNPQAPTLTVHFQALRTEELSTAASDKITLAALRAPGSIFDGWKMAAFTVEEARRVGYIAMRDPTNPTDVVLYARSDPDRPPSKTEPKALARIARIV